MESVDFTRMEDGTRAEYEFLGKLWNDHHQGRVADNVLAMLKTLEGPKLGYKIDRYQHSLQSATRALRDGADEEAVVCALLHDVGDTLAPDNDSGLAAAILRPYVNEANHWIVKHHGLFQATTTSTTSAATATPANATATIRGSRLASRSAPATIRTASIRVTTPCRSIPSSPWCNASSRARRGATCNRNDCARPTISKGEKVYPWARTFV